MSTKIESDDAIEELIEFEISRLDADNRTKGWTRWALYAGFSTVIWLLLSEADKGHFLPREGLITWGLLFSAYTSMPLLASLLALCDSGNSPSQPRFITFSAIEGSIVPILFFSGKLFLAYYATSQVVNYLPFTIYLGLFGTLMVAFFAMSLFGIPVPKSSDPARRIHNSLLPLAMLVLLGASIYHIGGLLDRSEGLLAVNSIKSGALLFALGELTSILLNKGTEQPFLNTLINMRRQLALGIITPEVAKRRVEMTLLGMKVGQIMAPEVRQFFLSLDQIESRAKTILDQTARISGILAKGENISSEDEELIVTRLSSIRAAHGQIRPFMDDAKKVAQRIHFKSKLLKGNAPSCAAEIDTLQSEMNSAIDKVVAALDAQHVQGKMLIKQFSTCSSEKLRTYAAAPAQARLSS